MTDPNQIPRASSGREWIDAALDRRVDPLDDPQIVLRLEAQPQLLDEFVRERELLRQIESADGRELELDRTGAIGDSASASTSASAAPDSVARRRPTAAAAAGLALLATAAALGIAGLLPTGPRPARRTPRVLSTQLQEHPPLLRAAATYVVHETLAHTESFEITTYEQKSQPR